MDQDEESNAQSACGSGQPEDYNVGLQVFGLFLILTLSALACSFPIAVRRFPKLPVPRHVLFLSRHFGTGILIATAFCHLLPTAFQSLLDPCLPTFWTDTYPAMAGLIAMFGTIIVVGIEMIFVTRSLPHGHHSDLTDPAALGPSVRHDGAEMSRRPTEIPCDEHGGNGDNPEDHPTATRAHADNATSCTDRPDADIEEQSMYAKSSGEDRLVLQCVLLEAGILFHSIFIGVAIAFSTGMAFVVLLVAIAFHQIFEGLALGTIIAAVDSFGPRSPKPWLMALAYGVTAPLGQAIGLGVHGVYSLESQTGLLTVGIFNAISRCVSLA